MPGRPPRVLAAVAVVATLAAGCAWTPREIDARPVEVAQSTEVYAADGTLLVTLHGEENREEVPLDRIPVHVRDAVVAIEDERFWEHRGVDLRAVVRAALANTREGAVVEGGSTITQQFVKNTVLDPERTLERKLEEAILAFQLERRYTKERILELYLNTIYFGNGAYGVQAAAQEYFGVPADRLDLAQAATLAAVIRSPSRDDPYTAPDRVRARRDRVLDKLAELGWQDAEAVEAARAAPLELAPATSDERYRAPHFVERVKRFVLHDPRFGETAEERRDLLFTGGLRIHTTVDLELQAAAEEALRRVLSDPGRDPEGALVALEARTGLVRALVGGRDFFGSDTTAKFDLATQGGRHAGSAFKPLVLAAALEEGIPLSTTYAAPSRLELPLTDGVWEVDNYGGAGYEPLDLVEATVRSVNTVYAQLIRDVGPADAMQVARRMGVTSPLSPFHASVLGTNDVTALDMATAYSTLANRGLHVPPVFVTRITRSDGTVLYEHQHRQARAISREAADRVTAVLRQVIERGTATGADIGRPAAGKTGTGQEWTDAWFAGYTPDLVTAVWVGFPLERVPMVPPRTRTRVTGGSWPAQIWQLFMSRALAEVPATPFVEPAPTTTVPRGEAPENDGPPPGAVRQARSQVPDVVGLPAAQAEAWLTREGFRVVRQDAPSDLYPPGYVAYQDPSGGTRAPGGAVVVLSIANGQRAAASVPDVLGASEADARARVRGAGFEVLVRHEAEPASSGSTPPGVVWKQNPAGGSTRARGDTVTVWVEP